MFFDVSKNFEQVSVERIENNVNVAGRIKGLSNVRSVGGSEEFKKLALV